MTQELFSKFIRKYIKLSELGWEANEYKPLKSNK